MALSHRRSFKDPIDLPQTCRHCKKPGGEDLKKEWGCDEPTSHAQLWIPCQDCPREGECATCHGDGWEEIRVCPQKLVWPEAWELLGLHAYWPEALPFAGGIYDQPAGYVAAMRWLDYVEGMLRDEIQRDLEREQRMRESRGGARG